MKQGDKPGDAQRRMQPWIYVGLFLGVAILQSIPRFTSELLEPQMLVQRVVLLALFFSLAWFFTHAVHDTMRWSILARMFYLETVLAAVIAVLLVGQILYPFLAFFTLAALLFRALFYAYIVSEPLGHMRTLVFASCSILLVAGELIITVGKGPF